MASRGVLVKEFLGHELWWKGPRRLMENCVSWTSNDDPMHKVRVQKESTTNSGEIKNEAVQYINLETKDSEWELINTFSNLSKQLHISIYF